LEIDHQMTESRRGAARARWCRPISPILHAALSTTQEHKMFRLEHLRTANTYREAEWDPERKRTLTFLGNELAGETGELCNMLKKAERELLGLPAADEIAAEIADVIIVADQIAAKFDIDLGTAIVEKFNASSKKYGFKTRLEPQFECGVVRIAADPSAA
jgi:NTP pyrophosphatase (non-canonical NTP hydrolase)